MTALMRAQVRREQGEEAWKETVRALVRDGIRRGGQAELFVQGFARAHPFVDFAEIKTQVAAEQT